MSYEPTELQSFTVSVMGITLFAVQHCERLLGGCLTYFLTRTDPISAEDFLRMDEQHRLAALGELRGILRGRFDLEPEFATSLQKFAADRNRFVHRLFHEPGASLDTDPGCAPVLDFMFALLDDSARIADTLSSLLATFIHADGRPLPDELLNLLRRPSPFGSPLNDLLNQRPK